MCLATAKSLREHSLSLWIFTGIHLFALHKSWPGFESCSLIIYPWLPAEPLTSSMRDVCAVKRCSFPPVENVWVLQQVQRGEGVSSHRREDEIPKIAHSSIKKPPNPVGWWSSLQESHPRTSDAIKKCPIPQVWSIASTVNAQIQELDWGQPAALCFL